MAIISVRLVAVVVAILLLNPSSLRSQVIGPEYSAPTASREGRGPVTHKCPVTVFTGTSTVDGHVPWKVVWNLTTGRVDGEHPGGGRVTGLVLSVTCVNDNTGNWMALRILITTFDPSQMNFCWVQLFAERGYGHCVRAVGYPTAYSIIEGKFISK
jgi:hypothetical protein